VITVPFNSAWSLSAVNKTCGNPSQTDNTLYHNKISLQYLKRKDGDCARPDFFGIIFSSVRARKRKQEKDFFRF
ncbi:MAG: hypothetical protein IKM73_11025, partial [Acidaminococcaceae bacterium]|nr:hypothetical protein [Acidaminococcaceae bacterium]